MAQEGDLLWTPSTERVAKAEITEFIAWVNERHATTLTDYRSLWQWSIDNVECFWRAIACKYGVVAPDVADELVVLESSEMPGAVWFPEVSLNFAEYLLRQGDPGQVAVYAESECAPTVRLTWGDLREQVAHLAAHLRSSGIGPGDHVCAYLPISAEAVVALLATISVGAVWSSCSPDFGNKSAMERFAQTQPKLFFGVSGYVYNGKHFDRSAEFGQLVDSLDTLQHVIYLPWVDRAEPKVPSVDATVDVVMWEEALANDADFATFAFEQVPFGHPIWVLYTSGTTGLPKGIVHSQGGVLLEFIKSGWLHDDLDPNSIKFFFTTTGWTMFNLLVGGLVTGSAIVVYDGSPTFPDAGRLFALSEKFGVTYFGASPTYVNALAAQSYSPKGRYDLSAVQTIALTGSPSAPETFEWFYENLHDDLHIVSMSGGTDVAAAFVGGAPVLPVHAGEIQAPCLAVEARAFDEEGNSIVGEDGELVILQPMPSMPIYMINDPDDERYISSYFETYPGIWRQGDLIRFRPDGRCVILGRSDSTLNRYGIRFGTAEIYRVVENLDEIRDSLIVNLELPGAKFFMPLFVVLSEGAVLDDALKQKVAQALRSQCSPRHVPDDIVAVDDVPYTLSGKKMEIPVKKLLAGKPLERAANAGACRNPGALDFFARFSPGNPA